jgi:hypothetical protein
MAEKTPRPKHNPGQRLRQYLRPDGRTIHIASSPSEAEELRRQLSRKQTEDQFDVYVQSTPEHVSIFTGERSLFFQLIIPPFPTPRSLLFARYMHIGNKRSRPCGGSTAMSLTNWTRSVRSSMRCPPS